MRTLGCDSACQKLFISPQVIDKYFIDIDLFHMDFIDIDLFVIVFDCHKSIRHRLYWRVFCHENISFLIFQRFFICNVMSEVILWFIIDYYWLLLLYDLLFRNVQLTYVIKVFRVYLYAKCQSLIIQGRPKLSRWKFKGVMEGNRGGGGQELGGLREPTYFFVFDFHNVLLTPKVIHSNKTMMPF